MDRFTALIIIQSAGGAVITTLTVSTSSAGARLTRVELREGADVRTNQLGVASPEYDAILRDTFGITLANTLDIETIQEEIKKQAVHKD